MLKIGDFSKISRCTVKTLRYYSDIGLLEPIHIDQFTGYRYYSPSQLLVTAKILRLKSIGFTLQQIKQVLLSVEAPQDMFEMLQKQLLITKKEVSAAQERVEIITEMINNQNKESTMENVKIETLPEVIVASKRLIIPNYNALYEEAPAMGKIMKEHGAICQSPSYCFNIYHDEEYGETDIDIEICEAVTAFHENRDGLIYKTINRVETAATIKHHGNYDSLAESYAIILKWIENNNYRITDKLRESFIDGIWNKVDPKDWLTVIQIPIEQM